MFKERLLQRDTNDKNLSWKIKRIACSKREQGADRKKEKAILKEQTKPWEVKGRENRNEKSVEGLEEDERISQKVEEKSQEKENGQKTLNTRRTNTRRTAPNW